MTSPCVPRVLLSWCEKIYIHLSLKPSVSIPISNEEAV